VWCSVVQCGAVCCCQLVCVVKCCNVLQCVAARRGIYTYAHQQPYSSKLFIIIIAHTHPHTQTHTHTNSHKHKHTHTQKFIIIIIIITHTHTHKHAYTHRQTHAQDRYLIQPGVVTRACVSNSVSSHTHTHTQQTHPDPDTDTETHKNHPIRAIGLTSAYVGKRSIHRNTQFTWFVAVCGSVLQCVAVRM